MLNSSWRISYYYSTQTQLSEQKSNFQFEWAVFTNLFAHSLTLKQRIQRTLPANKSLAWRRQLNDCCCWIDCSMDGWMGWDGIRGCPNGGKEDRQEQQQKVVQENSLKVGESAQQENKNKLHRKRQCTEYSGEDSAWSLLQKVVGQRYGKNRRKAHTHTH